MQNKIKHILFSFIFHLIFLTVKISSIIAFITGIKYWFPKKKNAVLYLENFPVENAGYQYRAGKWAEILNNNNISAKVLTIEESKEKFDTLIQNTQRLLIKSMLIRWIQVLMSIRYQTIIVRRELLLYNEYGNLFMEKMLFNMHQKKNVILDFDDDIAASKKQPKKITSWYGKLMLENGNKFNETLKIYQRFIVGSEYLKTLVIKRSENTKPENIVVIPTCVDYNKYTPKKYFFKDNIIHFGWIGGNHNLPLLENIIPSLNKISSHYDIELIIIAGKNPNFRTRFPITFLEWSMETEIENLLKIDIGLMPTLNDMRSKGKCGFKLIQYMGLGIPSIASNVGANKEIITHNKNGWLVNNTTWEQIIENILLEKENWNKLGENARKRICNNYTFKANTNKYIKAIRQNA